MDEYGMFYDVRSRLKKAGSWQVRSWWPESIKGSKKVKKGLCITREMFLDNKKARKQANCQTKYSTKTRTYNLPTAANQQRKIKGRGCHENRQKNIKQTTIRYKANYVTQYSCKYMSVAPKNRTKNECSLSQTRTWYRVEPAKTQECKFDQFG